MALVKNTANSQMTLRIEGEDRILKPNEAVEVGNAKDLLSQNPELREVKKVKVEVDKDVDVKQWESMSGTVVPDGKVLRRVNNTYEAVDEYTYEEVPHETPKESPNTILVEDVEDLPFADGRISKSEKTIARERKTGKEEHDRMEKAGKL